MTQPQYGPTPHGWGRQGGQPPTSSGSPKRNWFLRHKIATTAISVLLLIFIVGIAKGAPPAPVDAVSPAAATSTAAQPAATTSTTAATTTSPTTAPAPTTSSPTMTAAPVPAFTTPAPARVVPAPVAPAPLPAPAPAPNPIAPAPAPSGGSCGTDSYVNSSGNCVHDPVAAPSPPPGATAMCNDGTYSFSQHHSGTCSGHKGVALFYS